MLMDYSMNIVACCWSVDRQEREKTDMTWMRVIQSDNHLNQQNI
jgi:hypothetical protein